jgi:galactokinase
MTMAIDRDTWMAASSRSDRKVAVYSLDTHSGGEFCLDRIEHDSQSPWTNYVGGVASSLQQAGYPLQGFNALIHSTVPFSSGLSSSAALEMAAALVFQVAGGFHLDPVETALLCQKAENQFVGVNSGILDQYSSAMGKAGCALLIDCRHLSSTCMSISAGVSVVICDTHARRTLAGTEYGERRAQCEQGVQRLQKYYPGATALRDITLEQFEACEKDLPEIVARRCRFIIEENQRVIELAEALPAGDSERLQRLFAASYAGARDLYEIGAPAMEAMMAAMLAGPGLIAARQAGAGFGGCMVALVKDRDVDTFAGHVKKTYERATGTRPSVYTVTAAAGAGAL